MVLELSFTFSDLDYHRAVWLEFSKPNNAKLKIYGICRIGFHPLAEKSKT